VSDDGEGDDCDDGEDARVPLSGSTLFVGPSNVGKTRRTFAALECWVAEHGTDGVVVLDFAPVVERDGTVLGGRLAQFGGIPDGVWHGILDAHAPRADAGSDDAAFELARDNAERAATLLASAPAEPRAVFVNDATIPFQHSAGDLESFLAYCDRAACAVLNAFDSDELGSEDAVSRGERLALERLRAWADRVVDLS
jgi:PAS domain-containing protein